MSADARHKRLQPSALGVIMKRRGRSADVNPSGQSRGNELSVVASRLSDELRVRMGFEKGRREPEEARCGLRRGAHGVFDSLARIFDDPDHSTDETREIIIGHSVKQRLLLVSFTEWAPRVRIIGARSATRRERQAYEQNIKEKSQK